METVQVVRERRVDTEIAVLQAVRNSEQVANRIGSEQNAKGQDRTAADVVKRVPGLSSRPRERSATLAASTSP